MADNPDKTVLSQSSPNPFSTGNNENETENQRNSQQKSKNFMAPTISAASKFNSTPKNKIFTEWKSPKSDLHKMGNSNSAVMKSLPKIPSFNSPKNVVNFDKIDDECDDDAAFSPNSCGVPYDPLTNYLSPRPKFLRYRPNRRCGILVQTEEKSESGSGSLRDSFDSQGSNSAVSSSTEEIGENLISDEQVLHVENVISDEQVEVHEEIRDSDEEIRDSDEEIGDFDEEIGDFDEEEGGNWGLKWVFLKCLIVFSALFFCTMFICSMNSYSAPIQEFRVMTVDYEQFLNMSSRIVSLRSIDSRTWVLDVKNGSRTGVYGEVNDSAVESEENVGRIDEFSDSMQDEEDEVPEKTWDWDWDEMRSRLQDDEYFTDYVQNNLEAPIGKFQAQNVSDQENRVPASKSEYEQVGTEEAGMGNVAAGPDAKIQDSEGKSSDAEFGTEVENVAQDSAKALEEGHVVEFNKPIEDSEVNSKGEELANEVEVVPAVDSEAKFKEEESDIVNSEPNLQELQSETAAPEPAFKEEQSEIVTGKGYEEDFPMGSSERNLVENESPRLTSKELIWSLLSPLIAFGLLVFLLLKFCRRFKRASPKTKSSTAGKTSKTRPRLPPKAVEQADPHLHAPLVEKTDHSDLNPPSSSNPQESFEMTVISTVKQLGEFEIGVEFPHLLESCSAKSEMQEKDASIYSTPDTRGTLRRTSVSGRATNVQPSSYISQDTTSIKEEQDGKDDEVKNKVAGPTPRRSARLRDKGVTSP